VVFIAHTEGKELDRLKELVTAGLSGVELFNLHAMFAPDIRQEDLGLDSFGWIEDIAPFTSPDETGEPDLLVLGVLAEQLPSIQRWDALLAEGPVVGVAGTDAHQNVLPVELRDGERGDSYRRMLRWFSNFVMTETKGALPTLAALSAGRVYAVFEVLGTPEGFDFYLQDENGQVHEMGADAPAGTLVVGCPELTKDSPQGPDAPEVTVSIVLDGVLWKEGCGEFRVETPGVYRARVDMTPHHLLPFLGSDPEPWIRPFPWIYGNAIRVVE